MDGQRILVALTIWPAGRVNENSKV